MCGIAGFVDYNNRLDESDLIKMTDALAHRGPDDSGASVIQTEKARVGLGHRRLSILDLSPLGHQPMTYNQYQLIFNGEIYNFNEIRAELQTLGYTFISHSDSEVIIKAFECWGTQAVHRFIGMFAFALYDVKQNKLWIFRDRAGVKPLYYYHRDGLILFASELKAFYTSQRFKKEINPIGVQLFLKFGYIPTPHSIFKDTYKLKPGHYIELDLSNSKMNLIKYWDVTDFYNQPKLAITEDESIQSIEKLLVSAFKYRTVSDVPVGIFLSGGYDSTAVTAVLQKHSSQKMKTYSIGFHEEKFNEAAYAQQVANYLGTDHTEYYCSIDEAKEIVPLIPKIWDEPFGDESAIPTVLVSRLAAKSVKVVLSADGGDEVFAGYNKYRQLTSLYKKIALVNPKIRKVLSRLPLDKLVDVLPKVYNLPTRLHKIPGFFGTKNILDFNYLRESAITDAEMVNVVNKFSDQPEDTYFFDKINLEINDLLNALLCVDFKTYMLDDILTKVDRATMSVSIEGREPLLDHRIIEFASRLDSSLKTKEGIPKYLLKNIVHRYVPKEMMDRPKMGFSAPIEDWLKKDLREQIDYYLDPVRLKQKGILNEVIVAQLVKDFRNGSRFNIRKLWYLLVLAMWIEEWID